MITHKCDNCGQILNEDREYIYIIAMLGLEEDRVLFKKNQGNGMEFDLKQDMAFCDITCLALHVANKLEIKPDRKKMEGAVSLFKTEKLEGALSE